MENRNLTCIGCPLGCQLTVEMDGVDVKAVSGNSCKRGAEYGRKEVTNPTRIVTSSVRLMDGEAGVVPVKTESDIPKSDELPTKEQANKIIEPTNAVTKVIDVIESNDIMSSLSIIEEKIA